MNYTLALAMIVSLGAGSAVADDHQPNDECSAHERSGSVHEMKTKAAELGYDISRLEKALAIAQDARVADRSQRVGPARRPQSYVRKSRRIGYKAAASSAIRHASVSRITDPNQSRSYVLPGPPETLCFVARKTVVDRTQTAAAAKGMSGRSERGSRSRDSYAIWRSSIWPSGSKQTNSRYGKTDADDPQLPQP